MMNQTIKIGVGCGLGMLVIGLTQTARAQLYINSNTTINSGLTQNVFIGQLGHGGITNPTVAIIAGAAQSSSFITQAEGTSVVNMSGGSLAFLVGQASSTINITGGTITSGLDGFGNSRLDVRNASIKNLYMSGTSQAIYAASMPAGGVVELTNSSIFSFPKGTLTDIYGMDNAQIQLYINNFSYTNPVSNVPKTTVLGGTRNFDQYIITGRFGDAATITFNYWYQSGSQSFVQINAAIPEPTTLALFAVGGVGVVARLRRSRNK
jgi:PEP-CTERM motif